MPLRYGITQVPKRTQPSPPDEMAADILPVSSEMVIDHPRPACDPRRIMLPPRCSTVVNGDARPLAAEFTFCPLTSTLKKDGRFTLSGVTRVQLPSTRHSETSAGTQTSGTDPSYLPAAVVPAGAPTSTTAAAMTLNGRANSCIAILQCKSITCSPCSRGPSCTC